MRNKVEVYNILQVNREYLPALEESLNSLYLTTTVKGTPALNTDCGVCWHLYSALRDDYAVPDSKAHALSYELVCNYTGSVYPFWSLDEVTGSCWEGKSLRARQKLILEILGCVEEALNG